MNSRRTVRRFLLPLAAIIVGVAGYAVYAVATAPAEPRFERRIDATARDVTADFARFAGAAPHGTDPLDAYRLDAPAIETAFARVAGRLDGVRIVFVPSYLADGLLLTNRLSLTDYFASQLDGLRAAGYDAMLAPVDSEASVADNAAAIAAFVAADPRPVCFVSHSKGGLDMLRFLADADAATRARIVCWIALQAPFHGSPIADLAGGSRALRDLADPLAEWLGGSGQSLTDLTVAVRGPWMAGHDGTVRALVAAIPILCVATHIDTPGLDMPTLYMRPAYDWMVARGLANDGLVPVASAVLPGARYVDLPGLDHGDTVSDNAVLDSAADRLLFLEALFALTLSHQAPDGA
jgi:hypothetical protein